MNEKINQNQDELLLKCIQEWYETNKSFGQIEREKHLAAGTMIQKLNSIQDYKGTRRSIGKWLRSNHKIGSEVVIKETPPVSVIKKRPGRKPRPKQLNEQEKIEKQLMRELEEARRKIERLEAQKKRDDLRIMFYEGQIEEYRKIVKPSQSKKSNTK